MKKAIVGKKIGMTQIFTEDGRLVPVTVIEAGPCTVVQTKTVETDGYTAVQVGFGEMTEKRAEKLHTKAELGHYKKAGVEAKRVLREAMRAVQRDPGVKTGYLVVLAARDRATVAKSTEVERDLRAALSKLGMLCGGDHGAS